MRPSVYRVAGRYLGGPGGTLSWLVIFGGPSGGWETTYVDRDGRSLLRVLREIEKKLKRLKTPRDGVVSDISLGSESFRVYFDYDFPIEVEEALDDSKRALQRAFQNMSQRDQGIEWVLHGSVGGKQPSMLQITGESIEDGFEEGRTASNLPEMVIDKYQVRVNDAFASKLRRMFEPDFFMEGTPRGGFTFIHPETDGTSRWDFYFVRDEPGWYKVRFHYGKLALLQGIADQMKATTRRVAREAFNKYNPDELLGQLLHVLEQEGLVDAAQEVRRIIPKIQRSWRSRGKVARHVEARNPPLHEAAAADEALGVAYRSLVNLKLGFDSWGEIPPRTRPLYDLIGKTISEVADVRKDTHQIRMMVRRKKY